MSSSPPDDHWSYGVRAGDDGEYLIERGYLVASLRELPDGRWRTRVGLMWSEKLHRLEVAATRRQGKRWTQRWLPAQMED